MLISTKVEAPPDIICATAAVASAAAKPELFLSLRVPACFVSSTAPTASLFVAGIQAQAGP
jgi:hypothetical protein